MAINIYIASKNVGWNKINIQFPSFQDCVIISTAVLKGDQAAYEKLLMIRRFASSEDWSSNPESADLLEHAYKYVQNQKH